MNVIAPDGREWAVRRRWVPRHHGFARRWLDRRRSRRGAGTDGDGGGWWDLVTVPFELDDFLWLALLVAGVTALFFLGIPLLLAIVDVLVLIVFALAGGVARVLLRRPWTVEAVTAAGDRIERQVVGWRRAGAEVEVLASDLRHGRYV